MPTGEPARSTNPADLSVVEAAKLLRARTLSSSELVEACLRRIEERDGAHSFDGDESSVNAWVRVYADDARAAARRADDMLSAKAQREGRETPSLCGIPIGLKDLYAVAGKPLTASSRVLDVTPDADCDVWRKLRAAGMVLLGHTHTHEFAAGATAGQVGNPWDPSKFAGGSSGGSAAALAARMTPAAAGTDTGGSLRIPSAFCGTSTIKPTRGLVSAAGVVPLARTLDHCGPMARSLADCAALLAVMAGPDDADSTTAFASFQQATPASIQGLRVAVSDRPTTLDDDVRAGLEKTISVLDALGAIVVRPAGVTPDEATAEQLAVLCSEMLSYHRQFDAVRDRYRRSTLALLKRGEEDAISGEEYVRLQRYRRDTTLAWVRWMQTHRVDVLLEPTVPVVATGRGDDHRGVDAILVSLTYLWNWTGFPAVSIPVGIGQRSGLPVGISLIGKAGSDADLLSVGIALQETLGVPLPDRYREN
jgi:aspartyl-tRNA(Asn)/glutamyl-tRNA(Gln) amidotransferase subunit A